jgi:hypothetical protein
VARANAGPEVPTIVEKIVALFHIPYFFGALLLAGLIGPPGALLVAFVQTGSLSTAISSTVFLFTSNVVSVQGAIATILIFPLFFYALYAIRYMRTTVSKDEASIKDMLPGGEASYHGFFGSTTRKAPPLVLSALLFAAVIPSVSQGPNIFFTAPITLAFFLVAFPIALFLFSTFVWVYFSSIRGLRQLGGSPFKLKPYHEDSMLGVRPLGSLSLSFALVYFTGLVILSIDFVVNSTSAIPLTEGAIMGVLIFAGVIFFLLPLNAIHKKMVRFKKLELAELRRKFALAKGNFESVGPETPDASLGDLKDTLVQLTNVLIFDVDKGEVSSIPTWPFDTTILGRFAVILLSVTAIVLSKYIAIALGLG